MCSSTNLIQHLRERLMIRNNHRRVVVFEILVHDTATLACLQSIAGTIVANLLRRLIKFTNVILTSVAVFASAVAVR